MWLCASTGVLRATLTRKNYWYYVSCVYTIYSTYEVTVSSFIHIEQKTRKLFEIKFHKIYNVCRWNLNTLQHCSHILLWTEFKCPPHSRVKYQECNNNDQLVYYRTSTCIRMYVYNSHITNICAKIHYTVGTILTLNTKVTMKLITH
jgi:hypothetical protein